MSSGKVGIVLLIIEFIKTFDMEKNEQSELVSVEFKNTVDLQTVISDPWSIECYVTESPIGYYKTFKVFCFVDVSSVPEDEMENVFMLAEAKLGRKMLTYAAEKKAEYASIFRRLGGR